MDEVRNRSGNKHTICMSSLRGMTAASFEDLFSFTCDSPCTDPKFGQKDESGNGDGSPADGRTGSAEKCDPAMEREPSGFVRTIRTESGI
ncbi:hypothetical protein O3M35_011899 [Rhynocoris fuscipes]|uniref:Uncharacterized protein n=1 Tax=Rhynocoris fuscipes TaxID=488301 RepID=A0AAW1D2E3_9HEMI